MLGLVTGVKVAVAPWQRWARWLRALPKSPCICRAQRCSQRAAEPGASGLFLDTRYKDFFLQLLEARKIGHVIQNGSVRGI